MLKISHLHKSFNGIKAVNNVSFTLKKGKILAILGESGSGKTTLLHLIAALHEPDSGTLTLNGIRIIPPSEKLIAGHDDIKLVRQDYGLFPNISIRENIAYELRFYEENYRNKRIDKLLKISGLTKIQHQIPKQVSGGEQQRAVIVKAIAEQPKRNAARLLLLDEPFSHLDALNKRKLKHEILQIIKEEGVSCIFVTHDVSDAYAMADELIIMQKGKVLQTGSPEAIYQNPASRYVTQITGEVSWSAEFRTVRRAIMSLELAKEKTNIIPQIIQHRTANRSASHGEPFSTQIRPQQIRVSEKSDIRAVVMSVIFLGVYYEVMLQIEDFMLKMYSFDKIKVGDEVGIEIMPLS